MGGAPGGLPADDQSSPEVNMQSLLHNPLLPAAIVLLFHTMPSSKARVWQVTVKPVPGLSAP